MRRGEVDPEEPDETAWLGAVEVHRHIPMCFGCGTDNAVALHIELDLRPEGAVGRVRFGADHQGAPGLVHGGLLATLIDETMGAVRHGGRVTRLTAEMTLRYLRPTAIGTDLVCTATLGPAEGRRYAVRASVTAADRPDDVLVEAEAAYVLLRPKA